MMEQADALTIRRTTQPSPIDRANAWHRLCEAEAAQTAAAYIWNQDQTRAAFKAYRAACLNTEARRQIWLITIGETE